MQAKQSMAHEVTLHVALVHSFVNPCLLVVLHRGIRQVGCSRTSLLLGKTYKSKLYFPISVL